MTASAPSTSVDRLLADLLERATREIKAGQPLDLEALIAEYPEQADQLRQLLPAVQLLADLSRSVDANGSTPLGIDGPPTEPLGDFKILRELGRGGMGIVYEAVQLSLNRKVALKVLPFAATMDPRHLQRFRNEAQAAACLHHPSIVPVHGVGCDRGVHYYAMQLIEGQTLAEVISGRASQRERDVESGLDEKHVALTPRRSPSTAPNALLSTKRDRAHLRHIATLIASAADAMEYAHSMGVVHRDIKPGNLMIDFSPLPASGRGAGGEGCHLWITDFGLAKVFSPADPLSPHRQVGDLTLTGDLIGTLRYMSPEQALAKHGLVDHRTDIYSLGATLYELLTLKPAVAGADKAEILKAIAWDEPTPLRRHDKSIPTELETITLKCLAKEPAERYATAGELAEDLRRWLGDQTIKAKPPGLWQRLSRRGRQHPKALAAILAVAVLVAVGGVVSAVLIDQHRQQALAAAEAEKKANEIAQRRLAQIERGVELFAGMLKGINPRAEEKGGEPLFSQLRKKAEKAAAELDVEAVGDPLAVARLQTILGATLRELGSYPTAVAVLEKAGTTRERNLGNDHVDTLDTMHELAIAYQYDGRLPEAIWLMERVRDARVAKLETDHPDTLATMHNLALAYQDIGKLQEAIRVFEQVRELRIKKHKPDHTDTLITLNNLAVAYKVSGRLPDAIRLLEQVRDAQVKNLGRDHSITQATLNNLAAVYQDAGQLPEAITLFEQVRDSRLTKLGPDHPDTLTTLGNLADAYRDVGRLEEAIRLCEQVRDFRIAKLGPEHSSTLTCLNNLARAYLDAARLPEAIRLFEQVRDAESANLGPSHPSTLATVINLAHAYKTVGRLSDAIQLFEQIRDAKVAESGRDHPDTLITLHDLAEAFRLAGRLPEAISLFEQVLVSRATKLGPIHLSTLSTANSLGLAYQDSGELAKAIPLFAKAAEAITKLSLPPENARTVFANTVQAYEANRQYDKAEEWQRHLLELTKEQTGSQSIAYAGELAALGFLLLKQEKWTEAEIALRGCLPIRENLQPDSWKTFNTKSMLGATLFGQKRIVESEAMLLEGFEGMRKRESEIPSHWRFRLTESVERLVQLYDALENKAEADKWRKELEARRAAADKPPM